MKERKSVSLDRDLWDYVKKLGDEEQSLGIEKAIAICRQVEQDPENANKIVTENILNEIRRNHQKGMTQILVERKAMFAAIQAKSHLVHQAIKIAPPEKLQTVLDEIQVRLENFFPGNMKPLPALEEGEKVEPEGDATDKDTPAAT